MDDFDYISFLNNRDWKDSNGKNTKKKFHYCWVGGTAKPKSVQYCIDSWKKYCPDYEIIEWNEDNYDFSKNRYMKEAYDNKKWGFVPDYARLDIIYQHGGIYMDTDVEMVANLDDLLEYEDFLDLRILEMGNIMWTVDMVLVLLPITHCESSERFVW